MLNYMLLGKTNRVLLQAELRPIQGDRFQPTGFADIGAAEYTRPDVKGETGTPMLLVESAQSIANRLEETCLDENGLEIDPELAGLPYVTATLQGEGLEGIRTSFARGAASAGIAVFLMAKIWRAVRKRNGLLAKGCTQLEKEYDPNSLVHGVFLSLIGDGRVRVPRALSGFIEAENVKPAISGGVKNSSVDPRGEVQVVGGDPKKSKGVYSNVPYSRMEYVAEKITAFFNVDTLQIRSYGLGEAATQLLTALSLLKIKRFLEGDLRLRTACNLAIHGDAFAVAPSGFVLPQEQLLLSEVKRLIPMCKSQFADPAITHLRVPVKKVVKAELGKTSTREAAPEDSNGNES